MAEDSKIKALEKRIKELEKKIEESNSSHKNKAKEVRQNKGSKGISRREFIKKAGMGSAGLAALISPISAQYFIKDDSLSIETGTGPGDLENYFNVDQHGPVSVQNTDLIVENTSNNEVLQIPVYQSESDLPDKPEGSIAYLQDTEEIVVKTK